MISLPILLIVIIVIVVIVLIIQTVFLPKLYPVYPHIISLLLVLITLGLAIVNYMTYQKIAESNVDTIDNYEIRNRPFVQIKSRSIVKEKNVMNADTKELNTSFSPEFKLTNFGQFPALIESIDIWIEDEPKDLLMPTGSGDLNVENFALFQSDYIKSKDWRFLLGDSDTEKIKKIKNENNQVYFVFKIIYKILGDDKSLQKKPFVYWAKYKCDNPIDNREVATYDFTILECGADDKKPKQ